MLAAEAISEGTPLWTQVVYLLLAALVTGLLVPYLKRKAEEARASRQKLEAEGAESAQSAQSAMIQELKDFLYMRAASIAEKQFPQIAQSILTEKMNKFDVKALLHNLGQSLKSEALEAFKIQGIDLVAAFGDSYLDRLIESVANNVSPFPGQETAIEMLKDEVSNWLIDKGVHWVENKYRAEDRKTLFAKDLLKTTSD